METPDIERLKKNISDSAEAISSLSSKIDDVSRICDTVIEVLKQGGKILTAGNGGSAADSMHMAEEFIGRFKADRPSLPAVSLVADATAITCIGNDYGFDKIFSRQVEGLGKPEDALVLFSTSGNSENIVQALEVASAKGMKTICLLGKDGGKLAGKADCEIVVGGNATERIQEVHQVLIHLILDAVECVF